MQLWATVIQGVRLTEIRWEARCYSSQRRAHPQVIFHCDTLVRDSRKLTYPHVRTALHTMRSGTLVYHFGMHITESDCKPNEVINTHFVHADHGGDQQGPKFHGPSRHGQET